MPWDKQDDFSGGLCLDVAPHLMPSNCVATANDVVFDRGRSVRARGPVSSNEASATTAVATRLAYFKAGTTDATERLVGVGGEKINGGSGAFSPNVALFNESTFAITALESLQSCTYLGKPFQHLDVLAFPQLFATSATSTNIRLALYGGASTNHVASTTIALTAGDETAVATSTTGIEVGDMLYSTGTTDYIGRVTAVTDATHVKLSPVPTETDGAASGSFDDIINTLEAGATGNCNGKFGVSFQNRIILANTIVDVGASLQLNPRQIRWSILPDEPDDAAGIYHGYMQFTPNGFPTNNFLEIPDNEPITGLAKMGEGQLIIFGQTGCYRLTGQLQTQRAAVGGVQTVDLRRIPYGFGLVELYGERSIQQSKRGLVFAAAEGVMAYDGSRFYPLMQGSLERYWRKLVEASGFKVWGSAMLDDRHYMVTTNTESLYVNLDTLAWARSTAPCLSIFDSVRGLSTALTPRTYACRTYSTSSPPSTTAQLVMVNEAVAYPPATTGEDDDGTDLTFTLTTRPLLHGDESTPKTYRDVQATGYIYSSAATPDVELDVLPGLDPNGATAASVADPLTESTVNTRTRWFDHIPAAARRNYGMAVRIRKDDAGTNTQYVEIDEVSVKANVMSPDRMAGV